MDNTLNEDARNIFDRETWVAVAEHMPGDWHVGEIEGSQYNAHLTLRREEDGMELFLSSNYGTPAGKVVVRLSNEGIYEHRQYDESVPEINVSPTRKPDALGRDIARRLIPNAEAFLAVIRERIAAHDNYERQCAEVRSRLLATGVLEASRDHLYLTRQVNASGTVTNSKDRVWLNDFSLSVDDAVAVLDLLAERHPEPSQRETRKTWATH